MRRGLAASDTWPFSSCWSVIKHPIHRYPAFSPSHHPRSSQILKAGSSAHSVLGLDRRRQPRTSKASPKPFADTWVWRIQYVARFLFDTLCADLYSPPVQISKQELHCDQICQHGGCPWAFCAVDRRRRQVHQRIRDTKPSPAFCELLRCQPGGTGKSTSSCHLFKLITLLATAIQHRGGQLHRSPMLHAL